MSAAGMMPPTMTRTSAAPCSASRVITSCVAVRCAPDSTDRPMTAASSWMAVATICAGVWCSPV